MENFTMLQFFEWYYPAGGRLWNQLKNDAENLKKKGIDSVWLPPAYKAASGGLSAGYDVYDIYDLGEFDQKGTIATKYGTKQEYLDAIAAAQKAQLKVYVDVVLNHMGGADEIEKVNARKVDPANRNEFISEVYEIGAYTKFTFPGRKGKYSKFIWDWQCFSGIDYDAYKKETAIFSIQNQYGEGWKDVLDDENGNFDYLMLSDIDTRNPSVREELKKWGKWYFETAKFNGFRLDAIKHMDHGFYNEWLDYMRNEFKQEFFTVGEYWAFDLPKLLKYIEVTEGRMSLFDTLLHDNFHHASRAGKDYDLTAIFDNTLLSVKPELAVTLVENHDTQPLQSLEQPIDQWFKPLAYALILLREAGYPCVFYADMYGAKYTDKGGDGEDHEIELPVVTELETMLYVRKNMAYGTQRDYFDHPNCVGWTREGDTDHEDSGCAVVISNSEDGFKEMEIGAGHAGKVFVDYLNKHDGEEVVITADGWAEFKVKAGSVSVWGIKK
ncbi:alpha-amylase [Mucilaginibacter sp. NFR10]|uniref:alpha-amylase n=1 Tax=Mucilaginibacter sp. NFR10 TaxID=1566292 RepID=UPI0008714C86|nr:alpha-amylase [Mucilaginibacter sp. NFR10]SCW86968.1 alpha-amylase [Mucilaginibacter sp. NFR10]